MIGGENDRLKMNKKK